MSSWFGTVVRTDRKSALWWCSGDFCEEESSAFLLFFPPGILDIELRTLCKPARCFTTELHSCGVGSDLQPGCLLVPMHIFRHAFVYVGRGEFLDLLETLGLFSYSSSYSFGNYTLHREVS